MSPTSPEARMQAVPRPQVTDPQGAQDIEAIRQLSWEYRDFLLTQPPRDRAAVTAAYPEEVYRALMEALEARHSPPSGAMALARMPDGAPVACGMAAMLNPRDAEFKRVYVRPEARAMGLGHAVIRHLEAAARSLGATRVLMDTGRVLTGAQALYDKMGYRRRGPYAPGHADFADLLVFYEKDL